MKRILMILAIGLIFCVFANAQTAANNSENKQPKKSGVVLKIPKGVFPMDWKKSGFNGILMLRKDNPSGIFIAYPNDNETIEELRARAAKFIVPMFTHDEKNDKDIKFQISSIPNHKGDFGDSALYYLTENDKSEMQITFYERAANNTKFIYGYFAMKDKDEKPKKLKDIWADENGQGIKIFEEFWQSLGE